MNPLPFFLSLSNNIKLYHWMTTSYPRHVAADKLFDSLLASSDKFVEVYIGRYGRPRLSKRDLSSPLTVLTDATVLPYIDGALKYMTKDIMEHINEKDTDLVNIRDEVIADLNQTKYLFTLH